MRLKVVDVGAAEELQPAKHDLLEDGPAALRLLTRVSVRGAPDCGSAVAADAESTQSMGYGVHGDGPRSCDSLA